MPSAFDPTTIWVDDLDVDKADIRDTGTGLGKVKSELDELIDNALRNLSEDGSPELGSTLNCLDEIVTSPELQDYSETSPAQTGVTGALTIDFAAGPHHEITHGAGNITSVTVNNWPASGRTGSLTVDYVQDGTGGRTVTHPTGTVWAGGSPTFDTAADATNRVTYVTRDGGTEIVAHYGGAW